MVRARPSRRKSLSAVRAVEPRLDAGARRLPVPARAVGADARRRRWAGPAVTRSSSRYASPRGGAACAQRAPAAAPTSSPAMPRRRMPAQASRRRRRRGNSCGARSPRRVRCCCSQCRITSRRISHRSRCSGSRHSPSICSRSSCASTRPAGIGAMSSCRWRRRAIGVMAWTKADPKFTHELPLQIGVFCAGLFIACMFCHGELARLKPAPKYLTRFYLMISLGGAGGAVLVGIVAPLVLPGQLRARSAASSLARCCCSGRCGASIPCSSCSPRRPSSRRSAAACGRCASSTTT